MAKTDGADGLLRLGGASSGNTVPCVALWCSDRGVGSVPLPGLLVLVWDTLCGCVLMPSLSL